MVVLGIAFDEDALDGRDKGACPVEFASNKGGVGLFVVGKSGEAQGLD